MQIWRERSLQTQATRHSHKTHNSDVSGFSWSGSVCMIQVTPRNIASLRWVERIGHVLNSVAWSADAANHSADSSQHITQRQIASEMARLSWLASKPRNYLEYTPMHIMIEMTDIVMRQGWEGKCEDEEEKEIQRELTDLLSCTVLQEWPAPPSLSNEPQLPLSSAPQCQGH